MAVAKRINNLRESLQAELEDRPAALQKEIMMAFTKAVAKAVCKTLNVTERK